MAPANSKAEQYRDLACQYTFLPHTASLIFQSATFYAIWADEYAVFPVTIEKLLPCFSAS